MDQTVHEVRKASWYNIINECQTRPEGMTAKEWLKENGIPEKAYYYWQRKYRNDIIEKKQLSMTTSENTVTFAEITIPESRLLPLPATVVESHNPTAVIKCGGVTIEIANDISDVLLTRLLQEVVHA